jgi:hypothetical protein
MGKAGYRVDPGSLKDPLMAYDAVQDAMAMIRSLDRDSALALRGILERSRLSGHGPMGVAVADVLIAYSPLREEP